MEAAMMGLADCIIQAAGPFWLISGTSFPVGFFSRKGLLSVFQIQRVGMTTIKSRDTGRYKHKMARFVEKMIKALSKITS